MYNNTSRNISRTPEVTKARQTSIPPATILCNGVVRSLNLAAKKEDFFKHFLKVVTHFAQIIIVLIQFNVNNVNWVKKFSTEVFKISNLVLMLKWKTGTGSSCLMQISLLRISLLRFFKKFHKFALCVVLM